MISRHTTTLIGPMGLPLDANVIRVFGEPHYKDPVGPNFGRHLIATGCGHLYPRGPFGVRLVDYWGGRGSRVAPSLDGEWLRWDGQGLATVAPESAGAVVSCAGCLAWRAAQAPHGLAVLHDPGSEDEETGMILKTGGSR